MKESEPMMRIVRPLRSGQITIPAEFRKRLGIDESTMLQLTLVEGELRLKPVRVAETAAGSTWFKELYERFAPVREEAEQYREEEIDDAIQAALAASRKAHV